MLFLNFFLPAALLSNQRGFWKSKNIPIFAIYGYNVSQSMSSGHTLRMYSFLEGYWNCALASSFFLILRKAAPSLSFWTKIGLSFCPKGKFWVFLALEFSQKCWKKKPALKSKVTSGKVELRNGESKSRGYEFPPGLPRLTFSHFGY